MCTHSTIKRKSRCLRISALVLFLLLLQGCSFVNELLLVNASSETIVVRWRHGSKSDVRHSVRPVCYKANIVNDESEISSDTAKFYCRKEGDTLWYAEVPPNSALVLGSDHNQDLSKSEIKDRFAGQLGHLSILSPNDASFNCAGPGCSPSFRAERKARAVMIYR
jgi:hypothetical protein